MAGGDCGYGCGIAPAGVFAPGFGNEALAGQLSVGVAKRVCLSFADGVKKEGDELIAGGEDRDGDDVKGAGVSPSGREGCSGL
jgi:hypothetical protein